MKFDHECVMDGGTLELYMGYDSRFDEGGYRSCPQPNPQDPNYQEVTLMGSDLIKTYLCDDCFEKKMHLFEGWNKVPQPRPSHIRTI